MKARGFLEIGKKSVSNLFSFPSGVEVCVSGQCFPDDGRGVVLGFQARETQEDKVDDHQLEEEVKGDASGQFVGRHDKRE